MIDFFFAMIAAGMNSGGDDGGANMVATPMPGPVPLVAPAQSVIATAQAAATGTPSVTIGENVAIGSSAVVSDSGLLEGTSDKALAAAAKVPAASASSEFNMAVVPVGLVAEPQTPTGKFTTATEIKPILSATKGNWVAVREYDGKDLLYVTHLWGWRCGLAAMAISVNGEPMQNWPLPPCHMEYATPNAILEEDGQPYLRMRLGSVQSVEIQVVYDDLSMEKASFERGNILIP